MRRHTVLVALGVAAALSLSGCGAIHAGSSGGDGSLPVLRIGADGSVGMDAAQLASRSGQGAYRVEGSLPTGPSHAATYQVQPAVVDSVRRVADALGLDAAPRRHAHGWVVTSAAGELRMRDTGQWTFRRLTDQCPPFQIDVDSADGFGGVGCAMASGVVRPSPGHAGTGGVVVSGGMAPALSDGQLRAVAGPLLSALGLDPRAAVVTVETGTVTVNPVVAGLPTTGYDTDVVVDKNGVRAASGWAHSAEPVAGDSYPLLSAKDALKLFGSGPRPMMGAPAIACPENTKSPTSMPWICGGTLVVTGGRLGLELRWNGGPDGEPVLVPAWFLTVRGSDVPLVIVAVDPKYLANPTLPTREPNPATSVSAGPGSVGGGSGGSTGSGGAPVPAPQPARGMLPLSSFAVSADGRTLTLAGWGSPCEQYGPGPLDQTDGAVTVGIVVTASQPSGTACDDIAEQVTVHVDLSAPLGTRTVIDRATGAKVARR